MGLYDQTADILAGLYGPDAHASQAFVLDGVGCSGAKKLLESDPASYEGMSVDRCQLWLTTGQVPLPRLYQDMTLDGDTYTVEHAATDGQLDTIILLRGLA